MSWMLLLEGMVAMLLIATIGFCWRLNGKLDELRDARAEMGKLIGELDRATTRAAAAITDLKTASDGIGAALDDKMGAGRVLADDLQLMLETGNRLADRLEDDIGSARRASAPQGVQAAELRTEAERDLARVLRRVK